MEDQNLKINKKQLAQYNGKNGKPAYVAVDGKIYNVSESRLWKNGIHMNRHHAGCDLTSGLKAAPHDIETLQQFPEVGILKQKMDEAQPSIPKWIVRLLNKYPYFKRHPHPMVVHFPMTFFITCSIFLLWYYMVSPLRSLLDSIFYLHILGTISLPFAIFTGWLSWQVNYMGKPIGYITRKIILSTIVLIFDIIALISLIYQPEILISPKGIQIAIPIFIISYLPIVSTIGHHGGQLVY